MKLAHADCRPPGHERSVQLTHETDHSVADYVSMKAWRDAKLERYPVHPGGGCRIARHGTYGRKTPSGLRVVRYYCPDARLTLSLLPQFVAAGMAGTLQSVEDCAAAFEVEAVGSGNMLTWVYRNVSGGAGRTFPVCAGFLRILPTGAHPRCDASGGCGVQLGWLLVLSSPAP